MKVLVTGGSRSGKTGYALRRAESLAEVRTYLATCEARDAEMRDRIRRHQAERDASWQTLEEPWDIAPLLAREGVVLVDCLTLWLSNGLERLGDEDLAPARERLVEAVAAAPNPLVLVTNEVGLGLVPMHPVGRRFRDESGWLSQALAEVCDEVVLVACGLPLVLKAPGHSTR